MDRQGLTVVHLHRTQHPHYLRGRAAQELGRNRATVAVWRAADKTTWPIVGVRRTTVTRAGRRATWTASQAGRGTYARPVAIRRCGGGRDGGPTLHGLVCDAGRFRMARPNTSGRMLSTDALEGHCNEYGGLYFPPGTGGAYACLLPDGTLIVCGGGFPYYCVESRTVEDKGLGLSEVQVQDIKAQAADHERARIRAKADLDLAEVDVDALVKDENADLAAIENALEKAEAARTALRLGGLKARRVTLTVLSPEQRAALRSSIESQLGARSDERRGQDAPKGAPTQEP